VIAYFGLKSLTVVGHSLGGLIAMHLATRQPDLITKLVLFGPVRAPPPAGQAGCTARAAAVRSGGTAAVADAVVQNALSATTFRDRWVVAGFARELLSRQDSEGYALACLALGHSQDPQWARIRAKLTVVSGSEDKVSSPAVCQSIVVAVEDASLVTLEDCGHWHMLEDSKASIEVLRSALA
jgi:pimeloyl-ACP methyl ester carboxylesterase